MAIYSLSIKPASRGAGQNAVAMAAYRAGGRLFDQRAQEFKDYSRKSGITYTAIFYPPGVAFNRQELWNMAESAEKRKDARIAREILLALPHELTPQARKELAENYAQNLVKKYRIAVDLSLHNPDRNGDKRNYHAHLLLTTRQITESGLTEKSDLEREDKYLRQNGKKNGREQIEELRQEWENHCNLALEREGRKERVNSKSYAKMNILKLPTIHLGNSVTYLERRGIKTEKGNKNRAINHHNRIIYLKWKRWKTRKELQDLNREIFKMQRWTMQAHHQEAARAPEGQSMQVHPLEAARTPQEPIQRQEGKTGIAKLFEDAELKQKERRNEHDRNLSISDLLNKTKAKQHERLNREKNGLER